MSHRPVDIYPFVATGDVMYGGVLAFRRGDPVPADVADQFDYLESGLVVPVAEWDDRPEEVEEERPIERGEMPPHLKDKVAKDAPKEEKDDAKGGKAPSSKETTGSRQAAAVSRPKPDDGDKSK